MLQFRVRSFLRRLVEGAVLLVLVRHTLGGHGSRWQALRRGGVSISPPAGSAASDEADQERNHCLPRGVPRACPWLLEVPGGCFWEQAAQEGDESRGGATTGQRRPRRGGVQMLLLVLVFVLPQRLRSFIVFVALMLLLVLVLPQRLRRLRSSHVPLRARACKAKPKSTLMRAMLPRDMAIACMRHAVLMRLVPPFLGGCFRATPHAALSRSQKIIWCHAAVGF